MPKKTSTKKHPVAMPPEFPMETLPPQAQSRPIPVKTIIFVLALVAISYFAIQKGWVLAALVEGKPIFSWQVNSMLRARYGQQTVEGMIGESLIEKEAAKQNIAITQQEMENEQNKILASLGTGVSLDDFLKFQGMTKEDFMRQLRIQLMIERLLTKDLSISESDIDNFISTNSALLAATEPAALREEARRAIVDNAVSEKMQDWFLQLRQNANVTKFW